MFPDKAIDLLSRTVAKISRNKNVLTAEDIAIEISEISIQNLELQQNYPNPFNPVTKISVDVFVDTDYEIRVYDVTGKMIKKLQKQEESHFYLDLLLEFPHTLP